METTGEKGFHRNIKTSRKGGVSSFHVTPLSKKGPPSSVLLLLVSQKKKGKERKGKFGWIRSIFLQKIGGQNFIAISRVFFPCLLYVDPQLIEYIPKSDARALRRKGRLERKQKRLRALLLLLRRRRRRRQNMKRKSWLRHAPTRATTIQQQQQKQNFRWFSPQII